MTFKKFLFAKKNICNKNSKKIVQATGILCQWYMNYLHNDVQVMFIIYNNNKILLIFIITLFTDDNPKL
jgi:hypothetical protein